MEDWAPGIGAWSAWSSTARDILALYEIYLLKALSFSLTVDQAEFSELAEEIFGKYDAPHLQADSVQIYLDLIQLVIGIHTTSPVSTPQEIIPVEEETSYPAPLDILLQRCSISRGGGGGRVPITERVGSVLVRMDRFSPYSMPATKAASASSLPRAIFCRGED